MAQTSRITLPKHLHDWAESQARAHGLTDAENYVQRLIRQEQKRQAVAKLVSILQEAEASGFQDVTEETWEQTKRKLRRRLQETKLDVRKSHAKNR